MREVLTELMEAWRSDEVVGVGTVVGTQRSAPVHRARRCW